MGKCVTKAGADKRDKRLFRIKCFLCVNKNEQPHKKKAHTIDAGSL